MLPMLLGIGFLFFDGASKLGWAFCVGGALIIVLAILMSLSIHWEPTSLFNTLLMFGIRAASVHRSSAMSRSLKGTTSR
jgi:hypothetical protein